MYRVTVATLPASLVTLYEIFIKIEGAPPCGSVTMLLFFWFIKDRS